MVLPTSERSPVISERDMSCKDSLPCPKKSSVPAIVRTILYKNPPPQTVNVMSLHPRENPSETSAEYTVRTVVFTEEPLAQ